MPEDDRDRASRPPEAGRAAATGGDGSRPSGKSSGRPTDTRQSSSSQYQLCTHAPDHGEGVGRAAGGHHPGGVGVAGGRRRDQSAAAGHHPADRVARPAVDQERAEGGEEDEADDDDRAVWRGLWLERAEPTRQDDVDRRAGEVDAGRRPARATRARLPRASAAGRTGDAAVTCAFLTWFTSFRRRERTMRARGGRRQRRAAPRRRGPPSTRVRTPAKSATGASRAAESHRPSSTQATP